MTATAVHLARPASPARTLRPAHPAHALAPYGQPARILCVDDHPIVLEGLCAQFAHDGSLKVVRLLESAQDLLEAVADCLPDLVLLDIEMPGPDVFEVADRLRHRHPCLRFAFLSSYTRDGYLAAACRCGAWGYFSKSDRSTDLIAGIKAILRSTRSQFILGPAVASHLPRMHASCDPSLAHTHRELHAPTQGPDALTARELEVLHLIGKGLSRLEIAGELSRSVKTIDGHQDRIMKKLRAACRSDLLRYAIREGYAEA
ncbi:MAG: response regulator transcription factor [Planctomycetota bacterium]|nr:response regulator transcription factor [Planctomycetota bacterium]